MSGKNNYRIVIACGGTGGHLFPGVAVGEVLVRAGHKVALIISEKKIDAVAVSGHHEFEVHKFASVAMPKLYSPEIVLFLFKVLGSVSQCREMYRSFRPHAVLGMGGFTSTAPIYAGRKQGAATFIHESNVVPGKANRLNARLADEVLLGFGEAAKQFHNGCSTVVTGTPVRSALKQQIERSEVLQQLQLDADRPVVAVMGGSQGASGINHALVRIAPKLATANLQVIHLTGERDFQTVKEAYHNAQLPSYVRPFYHQMAEVYAVADLVVGRAGASSLAELSYFGIPSILIPYPYAADNHQLENAEIYASDGAAVVLSEGDRLAEELTLQLQALMAAPDKRKEMSAAAAGYESGAAAERVAEVILKQLEKGGGNGT